MLVQLLTVSLLLVTIETLPTLPPITLPFTLPTLFPPVQTTTTQQTTTITVTTTQPAPGTYKDLIVRKTYYSSPIICQTYVKRNFTAGTHSCFYYTPDQCGLDSGYPAVTLPLTGANCPTSSADFQKIVNTLFSAYQTAQGAAGR